MRRKNTVDKATEAAKPKTKQGKVLDTATNVALLGTVVFGSLVSLFPVFGNQLYVSGGSYQFGTVKEGTIIKHSFTVRNLHPWSVTVLNMAGDCGCTQSMTNRKPYSRLAPFASFDVAGTLDTHGKKQDVKQTIYVATSDNPKGTPLVFIGKVR